MEETLNKTFIIWIIIVIFHGGTHDDDDRDHYDDWEQEVLYSCYCCFRSNPRRNHHGFSFLTTQKPVAGEEDSNDLLHSKGETSDSCQF